MTYQEDTKRFNELMKYSVKCKCSHTIVMTKADRTICSHCGKWIYRTPQLEFKYKLKGCIKKGGTNEQKDRRIR